MHSQQGNQKGIAFFIRRLRKQRGRKEKAMPTKKIHDELTHAIVD